MCGSASNGSSRRRDDRLVHDVMFTVGVFSFSSWISTLTIVAALLTILGYSINDTVVIYDRIRENLRTLQADAASDLLELSSTRRCRAPS